MLNPNKTPYENGYTAALNGDSANRNPYEEKTHEHLEWIEGWVDGRVEYDKQRKGNKN